MTLQNLIERTFKDGEIPLLVKWYFLQSKTVNHVDHLLGGVIDTLLGLLGGSVGSSICRV